MVSKLFNRNKVYLILFVSVLLIMVLSTILETNIIGSTYNYLADSSYRNNVMKLNNNFDFYSCLIQFIRNTISNFEWHFDYIIIWATNIFQIILPFYAILSGVIYKKNNKKTNIKEILIQSLKYALTIFIAYLVFYVLIIIICKGHYSTYITRELFLDLLGTNFYYDHIYIYYLLDGLIRFILIPFIYISSGIALSYCIKDKISLSYYIIFYYFGLTLFSNVGANFVNQNFIYIDPLTVMISGSYNKISTLLLLFMNLIPLLLSIYAFSRKVEKYEM